MNSQYDVKLLKHLFSLTFYQNARFQKLVILKFINELFNDNCYVINHSNVSYNMFNVSRFFNYSNTINRLRVDFIKFVNFYSQKFIKRSFIDHNIFLMS